MLWVKALHIIFVVCWFAGIFYLPRLYVNLAATSDQAVASQLIEMAHRLYRFMLPLAVLAIVFGAWMLIVQWPAYRSAGWMHAKLVLVVLLIGYHLACGRILASFRDGTNRRSHVFYRWFNEVPVLFLFAITILVVVRPF